MGRKRKRGRKRRNRGWFKKGHDPRRKRGFPVEACRKGYRSAMEKLAQGDIRLYAWLYRKIRSFFRAKGTWFPNQEERFFDGEEEDSRPGAGDPGRDDGADSGGDDIPL